MVTNPRARIDARRNEQRILAILRRHPTGRISYDNLAAQVDIDRRTVISVIAFLRERRQLRVEPGRGNQPNRYQVAARRGQKCVGSD